MGRFGRADPRQRQGEAERGAGAIAAHDLDGPAGGGGIAVAAEALEPSGRFGMALRRKQHENAFADDVLLIVAEELFRRMVQREDASGRVEGHRAVGGAIKHVLQIVCRAVAAPRPPRRAAVVAEVRLSQPAKRDQRGWRAVPVHRLREAVDCERLAVRPDDAKSAALLHRHGLRIVSVEHVRKPVRCLEMLEIAIAQKIEQRVIQVERLRVPDDEHADRQSIEDRPGVALDRRLGGRVALPGGRGGRAAQAGSRWPGASATGVSSSAPGPAPHGASGRSARARFPGRRHARSC